MANRSDKQSAVLPREYKRMLAGGATRGYIKPADERSVRMLMIDAHSTAKHVRNKRSTLLTNVDKAGEEEAV